MRVFLYLWVCQAGGVRLEVVDDALGRPRQGGTAHQQHKQHDIWEGGCQVHHLECTQHMGMWSGRDRENSRDTSVMSSNRGEILKRNRGKLES